MNASQIKYARERAKALYNQRMAAIREKHSKAAVTLTREEKLAALHRGDFEVRPLDYRARYDSGYLSEYVAFTAEQQGTVEEDIKRDTEALTTEYTALMDELVLGDCTEALARLEQFAKG